MPARRSDTVYPGAKRFYAGHSKRHARVEFSLQAYHIFGIRLVYLPPYTPELQPAEILWTHVDEPIANGHLRP